MFRIKEGKLYANGIRVNTPYDVKDVVDMLTSIIVMLDVPPGKEDFTSNIYRYDSTGALMWQVQPLSEFDPQIKNIMPFDSISFEQKVLEADDFFGRKFFLDADTGKITNKQ